MKSIISPNFVELLMKWLPTEVERGMMIVHDLRYLGNAYLPPLPAERIEKQLSLKPTRSFIESANRRDIASVNEFMRHFGFAPETHEITSTDDRIYLPHRISRLTIHDETLDNSLNFMKALFKLKPQIPGFSCRDYDLPTTPGLKISSCHDYHAVEFTTALHINFRGLPIDDLQYDQSRNGVKFNLAPASEEQQAAATKFCKLMDKCADISARNASLQI